jgi:hypothetical protein
MSREPAVLNPAAFRACISRVRLERLRVRAAAVLSGLSAEGDGREEDRERLREEARGLVHDLSEIDEEAAEQ